VQNPALSLGFRIFFQQFESDWSHLIECIIECNLTVLLILFAFCQLAH